MPLPGVWNVKRTPKTFCTACIGQGIQVPSAGRVHIQSHWDTDITCSRENVQTGGEWEYKECMTLVVTVAGSTKHTPDIAYASTHVRFYLEHTIPWS